MTKRSNEHMTYEICEKCGLRIYNHRKQSHLCMGGMEDEKKQEDIKDK